MRTVALGSFCAVEAIRQPHWLAGRPYEGETKQTVLPRSSDPQRRGGLFRLRRSYVYCTQMAVGLARRVAVAAALALCRSPTSCPWKPIDEPKCSLSASGTPRAGQAMSQNIIIVPVDFANDEQVSSLKILIASYASGPTGGSQTLAESTLEASIRQNESVCSNVSHCLEQRMRTLYAESVYLEIYHIQRSPEMTLCLCKRCLRTEYSRRPPEPRDCDCSSRSRRRRGARSRVHGGYQGLQHLSGEGTLLHC